MILTVDIVITTLFWQCLLKFFYSGAREKIATIVQLVVGVALDLDERHFMQMCKLNEYLPKVDVLHLVL